MTVHASFLHVSLLLFVFDLRAGAEENGGLGGRKENAIRAGNSNYRQIGK